MRIDAYIGNPVIATQEDYYALEELLHEIDPDCEKIQLRQDVVIIENLAHRHSNIPETPLLSGWLTDCVTWSKKGCKC
ncbi:MAG TPA: hypothetical protein GXX42_13825 [Petrimonas sp.]|uniref:hypothetical protein n=1 Tax=Petrimonas sp. TaxID=2023866 RepID=UPI0017547714|nr:hypothetical protein [Petrimonas sp.]